MIRPRITRQEAAVIAFAVLVMLGFAAFIVLSASRAVDGLRVTPATAAPAVLYEEDTP